MDKHDALAALAALAHENRLDIFRLLIEAGAEGRAAGEIGAALGLPPATLSFHLNQLRQAGLVDVHRAGRSLIYVASFASMAALIAYLTENCCGGRESCGLDPSFTPPLAPTDVVGTKGGASRRAALPVSKTRLAPRR
jgi:ArsR family transcriptional regulator